FAIHVGRREGVGRRKWRGNEEDQEKGAHSRLLSLLFGQRCRLFLFNGFRGARGAVYENPRAGVPKESLGKVRVRLFYYIFGAPQLSFGLSAREISYNSQPLGEIHTVSYPGAFIKLGTANIINKRIALKNAL